MAHTILYAPESELGDEPLGPPPSTSNRLVPIQEYQNLSLAGSEQRIIVVSIGSRKYDTAQRRRYHQDSVCDVSNKATKRAAKSPPALCVTIGSSNGMCTYTRAAGTESFESNQHRSPYLPGLSFKFGRKRGTNPNPKHRMLRCDNAKTCCFINPKEGTIVRLPHSCE